MRVDIAYPLRTDAAGRTATAAPEEHIRQMVEQLVLTSPGERVMRPTFGGGVGRTLWAPISDALVSTLRFQLATSLTQELGDIIEVRTVEVGLEDAASGVLRVTIAYLVFETGLPGQTDLRLDGAA